MVLFSWLYSGSEDDAKQCYHYYLTHYHAGRIGCAFTRLIAKACFTLCVGTFLSVHLPVHSIILITITPFEVQITCD